MRQSETSQTYRALRLLRQLILNGRIEPSKRLTEVRASELTGASRTPVRAALQRLAAEGLVVEIPTGGYDVQTFSEQEIGGAIEVRGVLEGLTARVVAENGLAAPVLQTMRDLTKQMDDSLNQGEGEAAFTRYFQLNARFHSILNDAAPTVALRQSLERACAAPFASPSAFVAMQAVLSEARQLLFVANDQHKCVLDAIAGREGERAEAIMREHARVALRNLRLGLANPEALRVIPGGKLIRSEKSERDVRRRK